MVVGGESAVDAGCWAMGDGSLLATTDGNRRFEATKLLGLGAAVGSSAGTTIFVTPELIVSHLRSSLQSLKIPPTPPSPPCFRVEWCRHSVHDHTTTSLTHQQSAIDHEASNKLLIRCLTFDFSTYIFDTFHSDRLSINCRP